MSTTIQIIVLPSDSTFDQPTTPAGKQWKAALSYLATFPSWHSTFWGRHLEIPEHITLIIEWHHISAAQTYLTAHYESFAALLAPLLASPSALPSAVDIHPHPYKCITTIRTLTYDSLSAEQRLYLLSATFDLYVQELGPVAGHESEEDFLEGNAAWAVDAVSGAPTSTLWMLMSWEDVEAEQRVEKTFQIDGINMKEAYLGEMLGRADTSGEMYQPALKMLTPDMIKGWNESQNPDARSQEIGVRQSF